MALNDFKGKTILFISVKFFNYENIIIDTLKSYGADVAYFDERPSNSIFAKGIIRVKRELYKKKIEAYYYNILKSIEGKRLDYFFLIKGEVVPLFFIEQLKVLNPAITMIYYTYDSFENNPNAVDVVSYFDRKYTFDSADTKKYDMTFRPLFFSKEYSEICNESEDVAYDVMFVGTAHSDRYLISEKMAKWAQENSFKSFTFYYSPSKMVFLYKKAFDASFKKFDYSKISFKSLSHKAIVDLYKKSKIVLDINHPGQRGLTMRTFEALGAGKKIITTNDLIKKYPFYNSNNILVINREKFEFEKDFFESDFKPIDSDIYRAMSIDGWLDALFFIDDSKYWSDVIL
ncbi:CgeB family protein [Flavobacterium hauense]